MMRQGSGVGGNITRRTETEKEVRLELSADVLCDFDSAAIKPASTGYPSLVACPVL